MRILLTASPGGAGHVFPLVPLAWALRCSGHEILLATAGHETALGPGAGLTTIDVAPGLDMNALIAATFRNADGSAREGLPRELAIALFATASREMLDGTRSCVDIWSPDVVIYESMHGAGAVAAAERGIPAVEHAIVWASPPGVLVSAMWPSLAGGAPHVPPVAAIGVAPPSLASVPDPGWSVRPVPYTGGAVVPADVLAPPEQPRVLLTMGSVVPRTGGLGLMRELVGALAHEPMEVLVALGEDPAQLGPLPASVRAHPWVPLTAALPQCAAIVHHGGAGTCLAALAAGVPQVIIPKAPTSSSMPTRSSRTRMCAAQYC